MKSTIQKSAAKQKRERHGRRVVLHAVTGTCWRPDAPVAVKLDRQTLSALHVAACLEGVSPEEWIAERIATELEGYFAGYPVGGTPPYRRQAVA
jgi:hypothetical protein